MLKFFVRNVNYRFSLNSIPTLNISAKMRKKVINIQEKEQKPEAVAANFIKSGGVIAIPTDTIYGFACNADSEITVQRLYDIKGRNETKPIAICVSNLTELKKWGRATYLPDDLLNKLLPGPITIVLERTRRLNKSLNPHTLKIGIRIPDHKFVQNITELAGVPVALTSANLSSMPSCLSVDEFKFLYRKLDKVFDGGVLGKGLNEKRVGSTVIDLSVKGHYSVVREGIGFEKLIKLLNDYNIKPLQE